MLNALKILIVMMDFHAHIIDAADMDVYILQCHKEQIVQDSAIHAMHMAIVCLHHQD